VPQGHRTGDHRRDGLLLRRNTTGTPANGHTLDARELAPTINALLDVHHDLVVRHAVRVLDAHACGPAVVAVEDVVVFRREDAAAENLAVLPAAIAFAIPPTFLPFNSDWVAFRIWAGTRSSSTFAPVASTAARKSADASISPPPGCSRSACEPGTASPFQLRHVVTFDADAVGQNKFAPSTVTSHRSKFGACSPAARASWARTPSSWTRVATWSAGTRTFSPR
jgi:hypothetical protein